MNELSEEHITDEYSGNNSCQVCQQSASYSVTGESHTHATELYRQDIEGGIRGALEDTT